VKRKVEPETVSDDTVLHTRSETRNLTFKETLCLFCLCHCHCRRCQVLNILPKKDSAVWRQEFLSSLTTRACGRAPILLDRRGLRGSGFL